MWRVVVWLITLAVLAAAGLSVARRFLHWDEQPPSPPRLAIEVVNATGFDRVGRDVLLCLQARGFDARRVAGTEPVHETTTVRALRDTTLAAAHQVAAALAQRRRIWFVPVERWRRPGVALRLDSTRFADVQVVVGRDYRRFFPESVPLR